MSKIDAEYDYRKEINKSFLLKQIKLKKKKMDVTSDKINVFLYTLGRSKRFRVLRKDKLTEIRKTIVQTQKLLFVLQTQIREFQLKRRELIKDA